MMSRNILPRLRPALYTSVYVPRRPRQATHGFSQPAQRRTGQDRPGLGKAGLGRAGQGRVGQGARLSVPMYSIYTWSMCTPRDGMAWRAGSEWEVLQTSWTKRLNPSQGHHGIACLV